MQTAPRDDSGCQRSEEIGRRASVTSTRVSALLRWLPLVVGALVFDLTDNAMLGVALACVRFGEKDFSTALWLRLVDPVPSRGRVIAWFLVSMGLGKVALSGLLAVPIAAMTIGLLGRFPGGPVAMLIGQANGAVFTVIGAGLGFLVATWTATACAWSTGVRVWIGRSLHEARCRGEWPPTGDNTEVRRGNPLLGAVALAWVASLVTLMLLFVIALPANRRHDQEILYAACAVLFAGVLASRWVLVAFQRRIVATHPEECWSDSDDT